MRESGSAPLQSIDRQRHHIIFVQFTHHHAIGAERHRHAIALPREPTDDRAVGAKRGRGAARVERTTRVDDPQQLVA